MSAVAIPAGPQQRGRAVAEVNRRTALRIRYRPKFANTVATCYGSAAFEAAAPLLPSAG